MALNTDINILSKVPLFKGLNGDQLRLIAFGAEHLHLSAGGVLFRQNEPADCAYVIVHGSLQMISVDRAGNQEEQAIALPGSLISELALISAVSRKLTAVAREDCELLKISRALFYRLVEEYPDIGAIVEQRLRENFSALIGRIASMRHRFQ
jgi:CRP-like cAMP-binding protein